MFRPKIPAELKRRVLCEAGHRCAIHTCRQIEVEIHHIVPWAKCQEHKYENLIALCPNCHKMAERGNIDRKALRIYKANLCYAHDRFSQYEVDILFLLNSRQKIQFPPFMMLLINRILDAGYIDVVENRSVSMQVAGMEMSPVYISLTNKGQEYIDSLGIDQGN